MCWCSARVTLNKQIRTTVDEVWGTVGNNMTYRKGKQFLIIDGNRYYQINIEEMFDMDNIKYTDKELHLIYGTDIVDFAELILSRLKHKECGAICYLDLEDGIIKVVEDTHKLMKYIIISELHKNDILGCFIVNGEYNEGYEIALLSSLLKLDKCKQAIEKFYIEEE